MCVCLALLHLFTRVCLCELVCMLVCVRVCRARNGWSLPARRSAPPLCWRSPGCAQRRARRVPPPSPHRRRQLVPGDVVASLWGMCLSNEFTQLERGAQVPRRCWCRAQLCTRVRARGRWSLTRDSPPTKFLHRRAALPCLPAGGSAIVRGGAQLQQFVVARKELRDVDKGGVAIKIAEAEKKVGGSTGVLVSRMSC